MPCRMPPAAVKSRTLNPGQHRSARNPADVKRGQDRQEILVRSGSASAAALSVRSNSETGVNVMRSSTKSRSCLDRALAQAFRPRWEYTPPVRFNLLSAGQCSPSNARVASPQVRQSANERLERHAQAPRLQRQRTTASLGDNQPYDRSHTRYRLDSHAATACRQWRQTSDSDGAHGVPARASARARNTLASSSEGSSPNWLAPRGLETSNVSFTILCHQVK